MLFQKLLNQVWTGGFKMNKIYVIKFRDVEVHNHREEILDDDGQWYGEVGDIMTFPTKEKAQEFLNTLDSREYDRWVEEEATKSEVIKNE